MPETAAEALTLPSRLDVSAWVTMEPFETVPGFVWIRHGGTEELYHYRTFFNEIELTNSDNGELRQVLILRGKAVDCTCLDRRFRRRVCKHLVAAQAILNLF